MDLEGKVAAVTGGTRGIGRAIAEAFVREGAKVVINGRSEDKGQQTLKEMAAGDSAIFVAGDAKQREDCERVVDTAVDQFGRIDIMVNNAGGATNHAPVVDLTDEALDDSLRWNLWSTFWCTRRSLQHMIPQKSGRIINVSSLEGKCGKPGVSIYVTAKHAINGFTKSCAHEVGTMGITVNALCPGGIETDIMADEGPKAAEMMGMTYPEFLNWFAKESATKRLCEVEDVAHVAVLLASDAGAGITGALISIDGGTAPY
jgi:NAD(P)-dependent dehydrogenase (short-subunit alcohol dehydrogenase family)